MRAQQRCTRRPRPLARAVSDAIAAPAGGIMLLFEDHVEESSPTLTLVIPRVPSGYLEAKYEVHTSCMCISFSLSLYPFSLPLSAIAISHDIFSSRIKFPREKTRYVARLFMSPTSYDFRVRAHY